MESVIEYILESVLIIALFIGAIYGWKGINRLEESGGFFGKSWVQYALAALVLAVFFFFCYHTILIFDL